MILPYSIYIRKDLLDSSGKISIALLPSIVIPYLYIIYTLLY
jgi:hypothetical protein